MRIKSLVEEDFTNYKKASMFIGTISCSGKCCKEVGIPLTVCQNDEWRKMPLINIPDSTLCERYLRNPLTSAIVFGGLEPFEQFDELQSFLEALRGTYKCNDDVVIYTGYYPNEVTDKLKALSKYPNIIVKFGRFTPNQESHFDAVLGVSLASDNQYAERIS